ncbi:UDP-galactose transporter [Diplonema papillatum]|nr:UDP-galactose transporter [Diplonema papillatum]
MSLGAGVRGHRTSSPAAAPEVIVHAESPTFREKEKEEHKERAANSEPERPKLFGVEIRYLVLPLLTAQNASAVLLMRAVSSLPGEKEFSTQAAVIMQEVFKLLACVVILLVTEGTVNSAWNKPQEALKTAVPALLYLFQNNTQYLAASILDVATYTVSYQSKTLWTGILSVVLLGRTMMCHKWSAIAMLTAGVVLVNLSNVGKGRTEARALEEKTPAEKLMGLILINAAALASSGAGVYFEKILKGVKISLWARNLQLAFYSIIIGYIVLFSTVEHRTRVAEHGFFHGFTVATWLCVTVNAFGGLLCGAVIKYADAVSKDVSIGASIVLSTSASIFFFAYAVTTQVVVGILLVIYSVFVFSGNVKNPFEYVVSIAK